MSHLSANLHESDDSLATTNKTLADFEIEFLSDQTLVHVTIPVNMHILNDLDLAVALFGASLLPVTAVHHTVQHPAPVAEPCPRTEANQDREDNVSALAEPKEGEEEQEEEADPAVDNNPAEQENIVPPVIPPDEAP